MNETGAQWSGPDRALLLAVAAWGQAASPGALGVLRDDWRQRLEGASAWLAERLDDALERLRADHAASIRFDPAAVHPSWFARAIREESPAVRRAVMAHVPEPIRQAIGAAAPAETAEVPADLPPHPGALACALPLWAERLVGGPPASDDDEPVVIVLARTGGPTLARVLRYAALAKLAYALGGLDLGETQGLNAGDRARLDHFRGVWTDVEPTLVRVARADLEAGGHATGRALPRLGLATIARLLGAVEPHRARWAMQHLPYGVSRPIRRWMRSGAEGVSAAAIVAWESRILAAALDRLRAEVLDQGEDEAEADADLGAEGDG